MMDRMKMETKDMTQDGIEKIGELFPDVITEAIDPESKKIKKAVDFDLLRQILSDVIVEGGSERYNFTWPGKKEAIIEANTPIRKTLRPCLDNSKKWDETKNVYIRGDNLEALKLLQESYLNAVKLIYIDPPYNTGSDFIYDDDFSITKTEHDLKEGATTTEGDRLFKNTESNGQFHSDWCSMIYPRLRLARNLLSQNGSIFISIDDNEVDNLKKICNEIFGEQNYVGTVIWERAFAPKNDAKYISNSHDYIVIYAKAIDCFEIGMLERTDEANSRYKNIDNDPRGPWASDNLTVKTYSKEYDYEIVTPSGITVKPTGGRCWSTNKKRMGELIADNRIWFGEDGNNMPRLKRFLSEVQNGMVPTSIWYNKDVGHNQEGRQELKKLFDGKGYFDGPKPVRLMERILKVGNVHGGDVVLDFFAGSSSTAHACMKYAHDNKISVECISVQLEEKIDEDSEAYRDGYHTIADIGVDRIYRAGKMYETDGGLRVFRIDTSNMKDVYYSSQEYKQSMLDGSISNIKEDRNDLDLLYGVLIDWKLKLSAPIIKLSIDSATVFDVDSGAMLACFNSNITEHTIREIAKMKPVFAVFRDSSFNDVQNKINLEELFKNESPGTTIKVI